MKTNNLFLKSLINGVAIAICLKVLAGWVTRIKPPFGEVPGSRRFPDLESYITSQMKRLNIPGAVVAVIEGDKVVYERGFGKARPAESARHPAHPSSSAP